MIGIEVGASVVVPGVGVGTIERRELQSIGAETVELFHIDLGDRCSMMVPVDRFRSLGIRATISEEAVPTVWAAIEAAEAPEKRAHWNQRKQRFTQTLLDNRATDLASALGELILVNAKKGLSFSERSLLDKLKHIVLGELAVVTGQPAVALETRLSAVIPVAA
ncbi:MAG: RNA polymerase-interacting CarD/CdnL/TRCF family regulator [Myxococcota bacterium]|jgi:RNA polymerase-interacting CarD/CdnL/TRCF family regulator